MTQDSDFELIAKVLSKKPLLHRPDILYGKLSDGLDYCIFNSEAVKDTFFLSLVINVGSIHEDDKEKGIANFIQNLTLTELNDKLSNARSDHVLNITSSTDFHCTIHNIVSEINTTSIKDSELREIFFDVLGKFLECIYKFQSNLILQSDSFLSKIESVRNKTLNNILETKDSVENIIERKIFSQFHGDTILPKRWPIGDSSTVEKFTISSLLKFLQKWYFPNNMCLFIVGDIPASDELLVTHLSTLIAELNDKTADSNEPKDQKAVLISEHKKGFDIFSAKNRIGYKGMVERINVVNSDDSSSKSTNFKRELLYQHESIKQMSISIGIKLEICPLMDEGEIFYNAVDTIISNMIHSKLLSNVDKGGSGNTSVSWDFYNSARENCGWNTFSIVTEEENWKSVLKSSILQIKSVCEREITKDEFDEIVLITISDYKKAAEDEYCEDPKLVLDGLIDGWLCGSIPISKKQEYQLFCKILDHISPNVIKNRCNYLFSHIINYFKVKDGLPINSACIFVSKPLSSPVSDCGIENSSILTNYDKKDNNSKDKDADFMKTFLEELEKNIDCTSFNKRSYSHKDGNIFTEAICGSSRVESEFNIKNRLIDESEFGIWDALKASALITLEKLIDRFKTGISIITLNDSSITPDGLASLNGSYSVKQLDKIAERISSNIENYGNSDFNSELFREDICDLGLTEDFEENH